MSHSPSHFHLDHCGALPYFSEMVGYDGPIYMTHPTQAICPILLEDYRKIAVDKKGEANFFTSQMIKDCMKKVVAVHLHQTVQVRIPAPLCTSSESPWGLGLRHLILLLCLAPWSHQKTIVSSHIWHFTWENICGMSVCLCIYLCNQGCFPTGSAQAVVHNPGRFLPSQGRDLRYMQLVGSVIW